jgi:lipopolysaccharide transport system permease protein
VATTDAQHSLDRADDVERVLADRSAGAVGIPSAGDVLLIRPRGVFSIDVRELWAYRELVFFLVWRDIKVRYKQTVLGASWAILQPVTSMVIFSIIFGKFAKIPSDHLPYPLFAYAGLLPWTYFASCLTSSSLSVVGNSSLVTKVYFPRLLIPLETVMVPVVDFLLAFVVLVGMMGWYGIWPSWQVIAFPGFLALALATALGVGLWLGTLNVRYRDVPFTIPFLTQIWM